MERLVAPNVLALTTSGFNKQQLKFLHRFVGTVNLCLDLDKAGRDGAVAFIKNHGSSFKVRDLKYAHPKGGKDVGDIWKNIGDDAFRRHMSRCL